MDATGNTIELKLKLFIRKYIFLFIGKELLSFLQLETEARWYSDLGKIGNESGARVLTDRRHDMPVLGVVDTY